MKPFVFALAICGVAAACVPPEGGVGSSTPQPVENACGADQFQYLVGLPASTLANLRFPGETRILRPDTPMTMDYRIERLNIDINAVGRITRVYCT